MTPTRRRLILLLTLPASILLLTAGLSVAQRYGRRSAPITEDRKGVPDWKVDEKFKSDVFTFVRVEYTSGGGRGGRGGGFGGFFGGGGGRGGSWTTDYPDSDLNFSYRLQQLTSLKVNNLPITRKLTDADLGDYPFLYIIEPGSLVFSEEEVLALRKYLLNGGFLMVDDFWGEAAYENLRSEMARVFPKNLPKDLELDHEIFRCVYRLKEKPQVPNIDAALDGRAEGITYETRFGPSAKDVHYRGIFDDKGRMMVIICHNTDLGDGWEREGLDPWFFKEFSEKRAYPMGINIITYAMTH